MHSEQRLFNFNLTYYSIISLALILLSLWIKRGDEVFLINGLHSPLLDGYFAIITNLGDAFYFIPVLLVLVFIRYGYAVIMVITGLVHGIIVTIFKRLLFPDAGRPISILDVDQLYFVPGVNVYTKLSFPSGHTATAFAFFVLISLFFRSRLLTILFSLLALSVGISRIYLLQHFGIDIAMGATIGTLTAFITYYTIQTAGMNGWMNKRLQFNKNIRQRNIALLRQRFNSRG
jgi:membrane-associated phospholipid phosphatase